MIQLVVREIRRRKSKHQFLDNNLHNLKVLPSQIVDTIVTPYFHVDINNKFVNNIFTETKSSQTNNPLKYFGSNLEYSDRRTNS